MHTFFLLWPLGCALWCAGAMGQNIVQNTAPITPPITAPAQPLVAANPPAPGSDQRIERIHLEDNGTVVEEVRYGGQSQSINVQPKTSVRAYEIVPGDSPRSRGLARDALSSAPGQRVWNFFRF
jgi:hypothetical protein